VNGDALFACVETLAARYRAVFDTPGAKYDQHRARLKRFRKLDGVFGRLTVLSALGKASPGQLMTSAGIALGDHSSAPIARMLTTHGFEPPHGRPLRRRPLLPAIARLKRAIDEIERRPADDRALARFVLSELMSRYLPLIADGLEDVRSVLCVDDFSADRLGLLLAGAELGRPIGLMLMTAGVRPAPPLPVAVAICADEAQATAYPALRTCLRPGMASLPAPTAAKPAYAIGVVFNGKTDDAQIRAAHAALVAHPRVASVSLRLHPAFRPERPLDGLGVVEGGALADFVAASDIVVCGNSGSLIEIARLGAPVLFSDRIDHNPRDTHGFLARGLIMEDARPLDQVDFDAALAFYASPEWRARLEEAYPAETRSAFDARAACLDLLHRGTVESHAAIR
jgi:hypothetical protein